MGLKLELREIYMDVGTVFLDISAITAPRL
jgi:hypothetical protein